MNQPRPYILSETNWKSIQKTQFSVAVLPWGATEAHNYHLPYGTDHYLAQEVANISAEKAWNNGAKVVVLPCVPFGVNTGQIDVPFCMNMNPSTQYAVLKDIAQVLEKHSIHKLVIVNAHGGNNFKQMIRELSLVYPTIFACTLNWWEADQPNNFFDEAGDHAGELETSVMMHLYPELCLPLEEAGDGKSNNFTINALREGWVKTQRNWISVTQDTGVGNPRKSTSEKGRAYFEATTNAIAEFFEDLDQTDLSNLYE